MGSFEEDNKLRLIGTVENFIFLSFSLLSFKNCVKMKISLDYSWYKSDKIK